MNFKLTVIVLTWVYVATVLILISFCQLLPNDSWLPTVFLYSPRWIWTIPGLLLLLPAAWKVRRLVLPLSVSLIVMVWLGMGFCIPWRWPMTHSDHGARLRVLTCNCGGDQFEPAKFVKLIEELRPDLIVLQECGPKDAAGIRLAGNWLQHKHSGFMLLSRFPIELTDVYESTAISWRPIRAVAYKIDIDSRRVSFINVHLDTPREGFEALLAKNRNAIAIITANSTRRRLEANAVAAFADQHGQPCILAGDFNLPVESSLYEEAFGRCQNTFSCAGWGFGFTKLTRWHGVRIDHILATNDWTVHSAWVCPDVGSDHRPVVADVSLDGP
jgi:endonuclease/exonuclease/phosphatase (EEP) superfamily protein YafD